MPESEESKNKRKLVRLIGKLDNINKEIYDLKKKAKFKKDKAVLQDAVFRAGDAQNKLSQIKKRINKKGYSGIFTPKKRNR